jgi:hypothetical protein
MSWIMQEHRSDLHEVKDATFAFHPQRFLAHPFSPGDPAHQPTFRSLRRDFWEEQSLAREAMVLCTFCWIL